MLSVTRVMLNPGGGEDILLLQSLTGGERRGQNIDSVPLENFSYYLELNPDTALRPSQM